MKDELVKPRKSRKRRLTLGIDKVSSIIDQLDWSKLESCFGISFEFSSEMKKLRQANSNWLIADDKYLEQAWTELREIDWYKYGPE